MGSISFTSSMTATSHLHPLPTRRPHISTRPTPAVRTRPVLARAERDSSSYRPDFGTVDENMIVLRKRMRDVEAAERGFEPPSHWTEWEKRRYRSYGSDVCGLAGTIQSLLMNARPGVGVGLVALVAMSVPTSAVLILMHLLGAAARSDILGIMHIA